MELLERGREVAAVRALAEAAVAGTGRVVAVEGPAGIGKTAILDRAVAEARRAGLATARATGSELEASDAFGAVRQLLDRLLGRLEPAARAEVFAGSAGPAAALFEGGAVDSSAVQHALSWVVANLAETTPLLLVADDAQWFDPPSQRFLAFLARRVDDLPVALLVGTRPVPADNQVLAALLGGSGVEVLRPAPLTAAGVGSVVAAEWDRPADAEFVAACAEAAGGNPFLTKELLRALRDAAVEPAAAAAPEVLATGSLGAGRQVLRRVARLAPGDAELARAVAVLGPDATVPRLAALLDGRDEGSVAAALDALATAGLIPADGAVGFVHPLVRSAVYDDISPATRQWWHLRAARTLSAAAAPVDRVASHLLLVEPAGDGWAAGVLVQAAEAAAGRGAPDAAVPLWERALAETPAGAEQVDLLTGLGRAASAAGLPGAAETLTRAYDLTERGDPRRQNLFWLLRSAFVSADRQGEAVTLVLRAREEATTEEERLALDAGMAVATAGRRGPHNDAFVAAMRERDPDSLPVTLAATGGYIVGIAGAPAPIVHAFITSAYRRLRETPVSVGDLAIRTISLPALIYDHPDREEIVGWVEAQARAIPDVPLAAVTEFYRSLQFHREGAFTRAAAAAEAAIAAHELISRLDSYARFAKGILALSHLERADEAAARAVLADEARQTDPANLDLYECYLIEARARLHLRDGDTASALAGLRTGLAIQRLYGDGLLSIAGSGYTLALALHADGQPGEARELAAEFLAGARRIELPSEIGRAARVSGLVSADRDGAEAALRESVACFDGTGQPGEEARSLLELGALLRRTGSRTDARELLTRALELATRTGAALVAERARTELVTAGVRPRRDAAVSGVAALTASEARIAELAANGSTNKQIAQELFVTVRTVENHLQHAYQKLGISRRSELLTRISE